MFKINKLDFRKTSVLLFIFCSILFLFTKSHIVLSPYEDRMAPVEIDDSYSYMLEGERLTNCFVEECIGFETLKQQFNEDPFWDWGKLKTYHKVVSDKHFSYGLILSGTSSLFNLEIESVYYITQIIGLILGFIAIATLLLHFFGFTIAAITLLILSVDISQSTSWMKTFTPSNFSLISVVLFTLFYNKNSKIIKKTFYFLFFLLVLLIHPISTVYAITMIVLLTYEKSIKEIIESYLGEFLCIVFIFLFYKFSGTVNVTPMGIENLTLGKIIFYNFNSIHGYFLNNFLNTGMLLFMSLGLFYILMSNNNYRLLVLRISLVLIGSLLFYFHNAPGQLFFRLWDLLGPILISMALLGLKDINNFKFIKKIHKI